ncbi:cilia- and flagella-associated protein 53 [Trichechus manatus latirostris]|uniref:Cilia- and flagella-associated protein 53 n=1 Tax=Trichechus manatus latirostris TaxID=127582 RepID=A0A2Y9DRL5_TRIMA|nr:cilia- and flagella-associated protein 53 [Trichechus manatus latirostris]
MYSQRFGIAPREVKGPTPKVVLLRAKPPKGQGVERHLERIQHNHEKRQAILTSIKTNERNRLKVEWDQHNDRKFLDSLVQARIKDSMQGFIINTEERRNKLRELLASEENEYFTEMQSKEETIEVKKDRMREKARLLKEKKEKEKQIFVAEKLDQQFRERCEELRVELFGSHQKKVCEERKAQIAFNEERKRQKLVEEQMFSKLWEEDRLAKEQREAQAARRQRELVEDTRLGLNAQITAIQAQQRAAQQLKEEERRLVASDNAQIKLENEKEKLKKQKAKQEIRTVLQKALQEKIEHIQQECREEQDLNMKLVQRALQDLQEEADKKKQKKPLRPSFYSLNFLLPLLSSMPDPELVGAQGLVLQHSSMDPVQRKAKEQEERAMEQERINEGLRELNREEKENFARRCGLAQEYRRQLQMQIAAQQQAREAEKEETRREIEAGIAANKICQDKIQEILTNHQVLARNIHPMRRGCPDKLPP